MADLKRTNHHSGHRRGSVTQLDRPLYIFTVDVDWASEDCIEATLDAFAAWEIVPTVFVTHRSKLIAEAAKKNQIEVGLHPNFQPSSSHGTTVDEVFDSLLADWPSAASFRSHGFVDSSRISIAAAARGLRVDSNAVEFLASDIRPIWHWAGLWRLPVFWEDDIHWLVGEDWHFTEFRDRFFSPGLKVINVHPAIQAFNIPSQADYETLRPYLAIATKQQIEQLRRPSSGPADFVSQLLGDVKHSAAEVTSISRFTSRIESGDR